MYKITLATVLGVVLSGSMLIAQTQQAPSEQNGQPASDSTTAQAYPGSGHHARMNAKKQLKHLTRMLNLSPDQQGKILPILRQHRQEMRQLRGDQTLSKEDRRAKIRALNQDSKARLEAVLNDQQKQQFEEMLQRRRHHPHGGQMPAETPGQPQS